MKEPAPDSNTKDNNKKVFKDSEKSSEKENQESRKHSSLLIPIGLKDNRIYRYAGFSPTGLPIIVTNTIKNNKETHRIDIIPLKTTHNAEGRNLASEIKVVKNKSGGYLFLYKGEIYSKAELAKMLVLPAQEAEILQCLDALPISDEVYDEPNFYIEDNYIKFPQKFYASKNKPIQKLLVDNLKIGNIDPEILREGIELLSKYRKQLTLFYAITGQLIVNLLSQFAGLNDYPITVESIGSRDTGKSFATVLALKFNIGLGDKALLQDDALQSEFRHHVTISATNLYLYIEEAILKDKKFLKSLGKNLRGTKEQSLKIYETTASLVLSMNSDIINSDPDEEDAIAKRVAKFVFTDRDVVPEEERDKGKLFLMKLRTEPGGLLFNILPQRTIKEWVDLFLSIKGNSTAYRIAKFGALIYNDPDFEPIIENNMDNYIKEEFESLIRLYWARVEDPRILSESKGTQLLQTPFDIDKVRHGLDVDYEGNFKIRASLLKDFLKELKIEMPLKIFAKSMGYRYNTFTFDGVADTGVSGQLSKLTADSNSSQDKTDNKIGDSEIFKVDKMFDEYNNLEND